MIRPVRLQYTYSSTSIVAATGSEQINLLLLYLGRVEIVVAARDVNKLYVRKRRVVVYLQCE